MLPAVSRCSTVGQNESEWGEKAGRRRKAITSSSALISRDCHIFAITAFDTMIVDSKQSVSAYKITQNGSRHSCIATDTGRSR